MAQEREIMSQKNEMVELHRIGSDQLKKIEELSSLLRPMISTISTQIRSHQNIRRSDNERIDIHEENRNMLLPWLNLQFSAENVGEENHRNEEGEEIRHNEEDLQEEQNNDSVDVEESIVSPDDPQARRIWPETWIYLEKRTLLDGFFAWYTLRLPELRAQMDTSHYTKNEKNSIKNSFSVIRKAVKFMRYFVEGEILAPPEGASPMRLAQWKRSLAAIARDAQKKVVQYLLDNNLRKRRIYSLSGNARYIASAPLPNLPLARDFFGGSEDDAEADASLEPESAAVEVVLEEQEQDHLAICNDEEEIPLEFGRSSVEDMMNSIEMGAP
jgi:hypothetical protein